MELHALISLLIGIFGAAYGSIAALRNWGDEHVASRVNKSKTWMEDIGKMGSIVKESKNAAEGYYVIVIKSYRHWKNVLFGPTFVFGGWIIYIVIWLCFFSSDPTQICKWKFYKWPVFITAVIDSVFVGLLWIPYYNIKKNHKHLREQYGIAKAQHEKWEKTEGTNENDIPF